MTLAELEAGLGAVRESPKDQGTLALIVRRPGIETREVLEAGELDPLEGLVGDNWMTRGSGRTPDGSAHPDMQLTVMNVRVVDLVAETKDRWPLFGDQLIVDLDLSVDNLPPGARLALGDAIIEVTPSPHKGCRKFASRFGAEALQWISSPAGSRLRLRGLNARVVQGGMLRVGDVVKKV